MNCVKAVSSAMNAVPNCNRTTTRRSTIAHHCQRVRRNRSSRSVRTSSLAGAKPRVLVDSALARKQAIAKNPESKDSISSACVFIIPPGEIDLCSSVRDPDGHQFSAKNVAPYHRHCGSRNRARRAKAFVRKIGSRVDAQLTSSRDSSLQIWLRQVTSLW